MPRTASTAVVAACIVAAQALATWFLRLSLAAGFLRCFSGAEFAASAGACLLGVSVREPHRA
jgi:hypothetical protein